MDFVQDMTEFIFVEDKPQKADMIFIPGGDRGELAVTAAGLFREGYAPLVLPSGRYSKPVGRCLIPGYETEWEFLRDILVREGVPAEKILEEKQATYTYENAICSRRVTDAAGLAIRRAILCPQACHARRALLYYKILYPETEFFVCPTVTRGISRDNWFLDGEKIDVVLGELERCGSQFHEILREYAEKDRRKQDGHSGCDGTGKTGEGTGAEPGYGGPYQSKGTGGLCDAGGHKHSEIPFRKAS